MFHTTVQRLPRRELTTTTKYTLYRSPCIIVVIFYLKVTPEAYILGD